MKTTKKQQIINSLQQSIQDLKSRGIEYCKLNDLSYSYTNNEGETVEWLVELYSQHNSTLYEDKIACKYLKDNGHFVRNDGRFPEHNYNKLIIKL